MKYNKLSFIIPCYNAERTVIESLNSIYNQEIGIPFEVICTDDGSIDNTRQILEHYKLYHPNMKIYYHPRNMGEAFSANTCVLNSSGDIIFRLDSDNILEDNSIQPLIDLLENSGEECASFSYFKNFYTELIEKGRWVYKHNNFICTLQDIITSTNVPPSSGNYLFTRNSYNKVGGYPPGYGMASWGFGFRQVANGFNIAILPDSFYWHRLSQSSEWHRGEERNTNNLDGVSFVKEYDYLFTDKSKEWLHSESAEKYFFTGLVNGLLVLS